MPIAVVHGVNVRDYRPEYQPQREQTKQLIATHFAGVQINGETLTTAVADFAYWGDLGVEFAWDEASVPSTAEYDALGTVDDPLQAVAEVFATVVTGEDSNKLFLALARERGLIAAIELLCQSLGATLSDGRDDPEDRGVIESSVRFMMRAQVYAIENESPDWLREIENDNQFIDRLLSDVQELVVVNHDLHALGTFAEVRNRVVKAVESVKRSFTGWLRHGAGEAISERVMAKFRRPLNGVLGRFFGDIFIYLDTRDAEPGDGTIRGRVTELIDRAARSAISSGEPLVLVGHSLGGVVLFDVLSHYRTDIEVDLLITAGTQVAYFEESKLFKSSDTRIPTRDQPLASIPENIARWINVFDPVDLFGYSASKVFESVEDYEYNCGTNTVDAHSAYLVQERFFRLLIDRIKEGGAQ